MPGDDVRNLARLEAGRQLTAHVQQAPQLAGKAFAASQQAGRLEGRRRLVRQDEQKALVVLVELVEAELRKGDHPDDIAVVAHRHDEHRLVDVVGPWNVGAARVEIRVVDEKRNAVLGHPARETLPELAAKQREVDLLVGADHALEGDRDDVASRLEHVDPGVVVVDDLAGLLDDRPADGFNAARPAEARRCRLEHAQVGGSLLGLRDQIGVLEGDRGVRPESRDEGHVALLPVAWLEGHGRQRANDLPSWLSGTTMSPRNSKTPV